MNKLAVILFALSSGILLTNCATISPSDRAQLNCIHRCELSHLKYYGIEGGQCVCAQPRPPYIPNIP